MYKRVNESIERVNSALLALSWRSGHGGAHAESVLRLGARASYPAKGNWGELSLLSVVKT